MPPAPTYSLVVPVFNEDAVLPAFFAALEPVLDRLDGPAEVILVDDGSRDRSVAVIEAQIASDPRYRLATLSRNFGQQIAITAGLDLAAGRAVVILDADLQDPPAVVLALAARWREGFDVVCARRGTRPGDQRRKVLPAKVFYGLIRRLSRVDIPADVGDFRLVDRRVVDVVRSMPERERFVRGLFSWAGFRHGYVTFDRPPRAAGRTKYTVVGLTRVAMNAIVGFSDLPLQIALWSGLAVSSLALLFGAYVLLHWAIAAAPLPGWSSMAFLTAFLGGSNMMITGIMGLYVGRIYAEVKGRPLYVLDRMVGFEAAAPPVAGARGQLDALRRQVDATWDRVAS